MAMSSDYTLLLNEQQRLSGEIEQLYKNYKKSPLERRGKLEFVNKQILKVCDLFQHMAENHGKLATIDDKSNVYFTGKFFENFTLYHEKSLDVLISDQSKLKSHIPEVDPRLLPGGLVNQQPTLALPLQPNLQESQQSPLLPTTIGFLNTPNIHGQRGEFSNLDTQQILGVSTQQQTHTRSSSLTAINEDSAKNEINRLVKAQLSAFYIMDAKLNKCARSMNDMPHELLEINMNNIASQWDKIMLTNGRIFGLTETPPHYNLEMFSKLEDRVELLLAQLMSLKRSGGDELNVSTNSRNTSTHPQSNINQAIFHDLVHLPKVQIPKFDGNVLAWHSFKNLFEQMIDKSSISDSQKLYYLKSNLIGDAATMVTQMDLNLDTYHQAWERLCSKYDNKRQLTSALAERLFSQQVLKEESADGLRSLKEVTKEVLFSLEHIQICVSNCEPLLIFLLLRKLDAKSRLEFEYQLESPKENPTLQQFYNFLERRSQALEGVGKPTKAQPMKSKTIHHSSSEKSSVSTEFCPLCKDSHNLGKCEKFLDLPGHKKWNVVRFNRICGKCLRKGHFSNNCDAKCAKCGGKHHVALHKENEASSSIVQQATHAPTNQPGTSKTSQNAIGKSVHAIVNPKFETRNSQGFVFLGTVLLHVIDSKGRKVACRALLDSCSQVNVVSSNLVKKLGLKKIHSPINISGIGKEFALPVTDCSIFKISSMDGSFSSQIEAIILANISSYKPNEGKGIVKVISKQGVHLADPLFYKPDSIDLLLGAATVPQVELEGSLKLGANLPYLKKTSFGWMVIGFYDGSSSNLFCGLSTAELDFQLNAPRLWDMEIIPDKKVSSIQEKLAEEFFDRTTIRDSTGRFVVALPKANQFIELGDTYNIAFKRFLYLERRFEKNPQLFHSYRRFLDEYLSLGHMEQVPFESIPKIHCFIPHHAVFKEDSSTTSIRVVFDASCKSSYGVSLNSNLLKGPVIQNDIFNLLLKFRFPRYAMSADIAKMYRQILVTDSDQYLQLILWRNKPSDDISIFKLKTVTYGTTPAPFIAIKCLQRLGEDNSREFPMASKVIQQDFYVDDLITGFDDLSEAKIIQRDLLHIFSGAGMQLRKWCANDAELLEGISEMDREIEWSLKPSADCVKTLGLKWIPNLDVFSLKVVQHSNCTPITKRVISSESGAIFDPLGFINPFIVKAKLILQTLWKNKLDWDAEVPSEIKKEWSHFRTDLQKLVDWKIDRRVLCINASRVELHGFSDASQKAYGAVVYVRSSNGTNVVNQLLCSRSKVAPLKAVTIPKLELAAAKLLVELMERVKSSIQRKIDSIHYWCDSEIVLWWITKPSTSFKPFVSNRVGFIQEFTEPSQWRHIAGIENPADMVSRGLYIDDLLSSSLWFHGPEFLLCDESKWPNKEIGMTCNNTDAQGELKAKAVVSISVRENISNFDNDNLLEINHRNRFCTLKRVFGFVLRFIFNCRKKTVDKVARKNKFLEIRSMNKVKIRDEILKSTSPLSVEELTTALNSIVRYLQISFDLDSKKQKHLKKLSPFKDSENILRVGGRLQNSTLSFEVKHPMILPPCKITYLLLKQIHEDNLHVGPQSLLSIVRQKFWPIDGLRSCSKVFYKCIQCFNAKPRSYPQIMGNLPLSRTELIAPFHTTGLDYAGPFSIHYKIRGKRPTKAYLAVFVCFGIKAVHLEVVSDLTTVSFLGCVKRFIARRGKPVEILSDNATNFVGAREEHRRLMDFFKNHDNEIYKALADKGVKWSNIPPASPHFGGLWESSVKRAKFHLQHLVRNANLTFEEFNTVVIEVEFILNSRPLTPLSKNPSDLKALTANDFLIQGESSLIPEREITDVKIDLLKRWDIVSKLRQLMWARISVDYLHLLQSKTKWYESSKRLTEEDLLNQLVLLKSNNVSSLHWAKGRIENVIKGSDNIIRVVDVKTSNGTKRRAITEVCPLPLQSEDIPPGVNEPSSILKKQCSLTKNILISILYLVLLIPLVLGSTENFVNITEFQNHPGMYFDGVGRIDITRDQWHVITYFNLTSYWYNCNQFNSMLNILKPLCTSEPCKNSISELEHHIKDILELNSLIKEECHIRELVRSNKISRRRRSYHAPLDLIGKISHLAFGTLDSEYADNMEKSLAAVKNNEDRLLMMVRNHTTILDKTVNVIKKNNAEIIDKFRQMHEGYLVVTASQKKLERQTIFNTMMGYLTLILVKHREIQKQIHNSMKDFKKGRLDAVLINPFEFEQHIKDIDDIIGPSNRLPSKHFAELEAIASLAVVHSKNCLIFHIEIPLLRKEHFNLYRMLPVPTTVLNKMMYINPITEYLVISSTTNKYYLMSKFEFQQCLQFYDTKICNQEQVMYPFSTNNHCEVNFFLHKFEITPQCDIRYSTRNQYWFELHKPNAWLYSVSSRSIINVVCASKIRLSKIISGEGIVKIHSSCSFDVEGIDLPTRQVKYSTLFSEKILPVLPLIDISQNFTMKSTNNPIVLKLDNMEDISKILDIQKYEESNSLQSIEAPSNIPDAYHFVSFGLIGFLMLVTTLLVICLCHRSTHSNVNVELRNSEAPPLPALNFRVPEAIEMT